MTGIREDFAGAGGCSMGKRLAGITTPTVGVERDEAAAATARAAGFHRIVADVRDVRDRPWATLDGYTAGPPCQTFSVAGSGSGRRDLDALIDAAHKVAHGSLPEDVAPPGDERTVLVLEPMLVIARHRPQWVLLEQVPQVLPVWERYAEVLAEEWGYRAVAGVLRAEQYGVPQTRKRAVLIAHADRDVALPAPTHSAYHSSDPERIDDGYPSWVSMGAALGGDPYRNVHMRSNYGTGGDPAARGRRALWQPAPTVTGKIGRNFWSTGERVTVAEAAVLQTFPADYPWQGTVTEQYQQAGNAVPPKLSAAILEVLT